MKIEYERILPDKGSSFKVISIKSKDDRPFWHYHPEYEIVYVHRGAGKRHVGNHLSNYEEGELVFIGPDLPHSGFSYGVVGEHEEVVVQMKNNFLGEYSLNIPELSDIKRLFEMSKLGISFHGETQKSIARQLVKLLKMTEFNRLIEILKILQTLATSQDFTLLNPVGSRFEFSHQDKDRIERVYEFVATHFQKEITTDEVADLVSLTVPSFCRYFKKITQQTFIEFLNEYRINQACKLLTINNIVSDVSFACGFNNLSHFTKTFKHITGKTPRDYRKGLI
jgi:AraC-like DNA-binding protein/mannose-6-phosphate isomerase-like protein (cupin superfamily)